MGEREDEAMHGAAAMQGTAIDADDAGHGMIDLSSTSADAATLYAPATAEVPPAVEVVVADPQELAAVAAEVATTVARHREELAAAMAELTALQRTLRSEVRAVVAELDRIAAGIAPEAVEELAEQHVTSPPPKRARWRPRAARA
jgi:hypothetical protein